jgi:hypothetical protein
MQQYQYKRKVRTIQYEVSLRTITIVNTNVWSIQGRLQNWCFTGRTTFYMDGPGSRGHALQCILVGRKLTTLRLHYRDITLAMFYLSIIAHLYI